MQIAKLKFWIIAVLTILVGTVFSGCSESRPSNQLVIWSWAAPAQALEKSLTDFRQQFPNVELKIEQMERETLYTRLFQAYLAGGTGLPDIAVVEDARLESFNEKFPNAFLNLNDYAGKYRLDFSAIKWAQAEYKNKIRALPWSVAPVVLYYRADLLPASLAEIETWADFIALAQAAATKNWLGLDTSSDFFSRALLNQQNTSYFAADSRINLLAPEVANTLAILQKLKEANLLETVGNPANLIAGLKSNQIKAWLATPEFASFLERELPEQTGKWRVIPPPAINPGGKRVAQTGGLTLVISSKSPNTALAWRYLESTLADATTQNRIFQQTGLLPAFLPALKDSLYNKPQSYFGNQVVGQIFTEQVANLTPFNFTEYHSKAEKIIIEAQQAILAGRPLQTVQTVLENAAAKLKIETGKEFFGS